MSSRLVRPENALEDALLAAREQDDVARLLGALATSDVYVPAEGTGPDEETAVTAGPADRLPVPVIELDGRSVVPVFTSLAQLGRFRPEGGGYVRFEGRALSAVTPADIGVAVNPGGDLGLTLTPEQVAALGAAEADESEPDFLIGEPREEPLRLLEAMRGLARTREDVRAVYRALLLRPPGGEPEPVIGLELEPGADPRAAVAAAADAARAAGIERLALLPLQPGVDPGRIGRFLLERTRPFWSRDEVDV